LNVADGEIVALLGPNGAGKTTTLRMLAGLIAPTSGSVEMDGVPLTRATSGRLRRRIGFLTETPGLWDRLTVEENLAVYAGIYGLADAGRAVAHVMDLFELTERASTRTAELSKGMRQKVALARALLHDPAVLLLDEPTSGLDPARGAELMRTLRQLASEGTTVVLTTHNPLDAERCDKIAVLAEHGYLAFFGSPEQACAYFGAGSISEIYERLAGPDPAVPDPPDGHPLSGVPPDTVFLVRP